MPALFLPFVSRFSAFSDLLQLLSLPVWMCQAKKKSQVSGSGFPVQGLSSRQVSFSLFFSESLEKHLCSASWCWLQALSVGIASLGNQFEALGWVLKWTIGFLSLASSSRQGGLGLHSLPGDLDIILSLSLVLASLRYPLLHCIINNAVCSLVISRKTSGFTPSSEGQCGNSFKPWQGLTVVGRCFGRLSHLGFSVMLCSG